MTIPLRVQSAPGSCPHAPAAVIEPAVLQQITVLAAKPESEEVLKLLNGFGPKWQSLGQDD